MRHNLSTLTKIGSSLNLDSILTQHYPNRDLFLITDQNIDNLYANKISAPKAKFVLTPGDANKTYEKAGLIAEHFLSHGINRDSIIIAFGGGMVTDISGFVASIIHRGIAYINIPTTLLAMADSSIGGKTAVNTTLGKNQLGTIYHPQKVIIDIDYLKTISELEFLSGYAEILKMALILDLDLFDFLESSYQKILNRDRNSLLYIITKALALKALIVEEDERDQNVRMKLNFGHSFGHAIEKILGYKIPHGICVAEGMLHELYLSKHYTNFPEIDYNRVMLHFEKMGLKRGLPVTLDEIITSIYYDKKHFGGKFRLVLLNSIGSADLFTMEETEIEDKLKVCNI